MREILCVNRDSHFDFSATLAFSGPPVSLMKAKRNAANVRSYYERNKKIVLFRKAMKRCRDSGAVPTPNSMRANEIPLTALLVAFADWAGRAHNAKIKEQHKKLVRLRSALGPDRKTEFTDPTPGERQALTYMRRFSH